MDVLEAIRGRRSAREYLQDPIEESVIRSLIDAAVQAPSAVNEQPWRFAVVRDQRRLDTLSAACKSFMLTTHPAPQLASHVPMLRDPNFQIFYHAPALIVISAAHAGPWHIEDCALAAENLMLAAYAAGLGTCWIGFAQGYLNTPAGKALLGLDEACAPVAPIIVGRPRALPAPVARQAPQIRWIGPGSPAQGA